MEQLTQCRVQEETWNFLQIKRFLVFRFRGNFLMYLPLHVIFFGMANRTELIDSGRYLESCWLALDYTNIFFWLFLKLLVYLCNFWIYDCFIFTFHCVISVRCVNGKVFFWDTRILTVAAAEEIWERLYKMTERIPFYNIALKN